MSVRKDGGRALLLASHLAADAVLVHLDHRQHMPEDDFDRFIGAGGWIESDAKLGRVIPGVESDSGGSLPIRVLVEPLELDLAADLSLVFDHIALLTEEVSGQEKFDLVLPEAMAANGSGKAVHMKTST